MRRYRTGATRLVFPCLAAAMAVGLAACVGLSPPSAPAGDAISGRLAVRVEPVDGSAARVENATFELRGNADDGQLDLSTPLGTVMARARWSPDEVSLSTPQGQARYADLASLGEQVLGTPIPIAALFDWLHGRPWAGAPIRSSAETGKAGFAQLGWAIELDEFDNGWVVARHASPPETILRVRLDR